MSEPSVLYKVINDIAILTLNRPKQMNSLTPDMMGVLQTLITKANEDIKVRAIIITGNERSFSAGADIKNRSSEREEMDDIGSATYNAMNNKYNPAIESLYYSNKPTIAALQGSVAGAGVGIALACDFRVMGESSYFLMAFVNIALIPDAGCTYFLPRFLGYPKALELALSGERVPSKTCLELGLTNHVVKDQDVMNKAIAVATFFGSKPAFAMALTKSALRFGQASSLIDTLQNEAKLQQFCVGSEDNIEGILAFSQKRKSNFSHTKPKLPGGFLAKL